MIKKFKFRIILYSILFLMLCVGIWLYIGSKIPDNYFIFEGQSVDFGTVPVTSSATDISDDRYNLDVKILGVIPVKKVSVRVVDENSVIAGGEPFGVKLYTDGVVIVGMSDVVSAEKTANPAFDAGIRVGDIVKKVNGQNISSNEQLGTLIENSKGSVTMELLRGVLSYSVTFSPLVEEATKSNKIGLWVRDSAAGIGTVTYYDPTSRTFAGLGHSICDHDTGIAMPLSYAEVVGVDVTSVKKSESGLPGELKGNFSETAVIGDLYSNSEEGIFGNVASSFTFPSNETVKIAFKQDVYEGVAKIRCCINGNRAEDYSIEIIRINRNSTQKTKNMVVRVTDERLLAATGGIVQGMSGSPILQDGKLVGAVTHVLINSPTDGYAIFIENMLNE